MIWTLMIITGILTFLMRYSLDCYYQTRVIKRNNKKVLTYVPSAVFPAIIFPAVFLNKNQSLQFNTYEVYAFICINSCIFYKKYNFNYCNRLDCYLIFYSVYIMKNLNNKL